MLKNIPKIVIRPASLFVMLLLIISPSLANTVCVTEPFTAITSNQGSIPLPATGKFVLESHLATKSDSFPNSPNKLFPESATEGMNDHLDRSCQVIKTRAPRKIDLSMAETIEISWGILNKIDLLSINLN